MDPEDAEYKCNLDEYSLKKAVEELHEDPKQRLSSVKALRSWIRSQPHFTSRTDTIFLLQVLRTAKFSQLRAREIIESIITLRTKYSQFVVNVDTHDTNIALFLDKGYILPLPKRDKDGKIIIILRAEVVNPDDPRMSFTNELRTSLCVQECLKETDENAFVNGFVIIYDLTGASPKLFARLGPDNLKITGKIYQECNTGRLKGFVIYNGGALFDMMLPVLKTVLRKKLLDRVYSHSTMESLYALVPKELWPDEYLPDDYKGPSAGSIKDIAEDTKRRVMDPQYRARNLEYSSDKYKIDEKKRITGTPVGSFRKLNMD